MNVIVIGGGASGLMAAITAAKGGHSVTLLERQARVGRKLLSTGNGRCNLTNLNMGLPYYHGQDAAFIRPAFEALSLDATLDFFHGLGLLTTAEDNGRVYPYSDQAGSVVDVLRFAADAAGVTTRAGFEVTGLKKTKQGFTVLSAEETLPADRVIVCCGGMAGGKLGGTRSGYELLQSLGHSVTKLYPALVQIKTDNTFVKALKGVRPMLTSGSAGTGMPWLPAGVKFSLPTSVSAAPPCLSCPDPPPRKKGPLTLHIDLLPQLSTPEIEELLRRRLSSMPELTTENLLAGVLHNRLGRTVLRYAGYGLTDPVASLSPADLWKIAGAAKTSLCRWSAYWALTGRRSRQAVSVPPSLTPKPSKAAWCRDCTPPVRCWTSTVTAAATICNGPGPAAIWPAC